MVFCRRLKDNKSIQHEDYEEGLDVEGQHRSVRIKDTINPEMENCDNCCPRRPFRKSSSYLETPQTNPVRKYQLMKLVPSMRTIRPRCLPERIKFDPKR